MENKTSWRDTIPFGYHKMGTALNKINVEKLDCVIVLNAPSQKMIENDPQTMKLFIESNGLGKLIGKEQKVVKIAETTALITTKESRCSFNLNMWDYTLKVAGAEVSLEDLLSEFHLKDATSELKDLFSTKNKDGDFFEFGKKSLMEYYLVDKNKFSEFCGLFVDSQFSLPDDKEQRKDLILSVNEGEPGAGYYLEKYVPTVSERKLSPTQSVKKP